MTAKLTIPGKLWWNLTDSFDNPKNTSVDKTVVKKISKKVNKTQFKQQASEIATKNSLSVNSKLEAEGAYGVTSASVSVEVAVSQEVNETLSRLKKLETKDEDTEEKSDSTVCMTYFSFLTPAEFLGPLTDSRQNRSRR